MENKKEILAKLQGLEEQVEISTRLLIAFIIVSQFQGKNLRLFMLREEINEIISAKGDAMNLTRILNALN